MLSTASAMSRRALTGLSKGKHRLALGSSANRFLQGVGRGEINLDAEQVPQAVFQLDHIDEREPAPRLELGDQVDVGIRRRFSTCDGAMEAQVDNPGRTQFRSVCPELFNDLAPLHTSTVPYRGWVDNSFGPYFVVAKTPIANIRLTTFFAGEAEVRVSRLHSRKSAAFQFGTRCDGYPRRKCRELAPRSIDDAKKRGHCHHVSVVLRALPLVGTAGFGTNEGLRRPSAFGCVCHIQTVALDLLVQMPPPILAQSKAMHSLDGIEHERLQLPTVDARTAYPLLLTPVLRSFRRMLAAASRIVAA